MLISMGWNLSAELRARHDARESRAEDLETIASLGERVARMEAERDEGEAQREQLRLELRAREKNQNVFGAGAATLKTGSTTEWMLKPKNGRRASSTAKR